MNNKDLSIDLAMFFQKLPSRKRHGSQKGGKRKTAEKKLKYKRKWYKENVNDVSGYNREYYEKNKKKLKEKRESKKR